MAVILFICFLIISYYQSQKLIKIANAKIKELTENYEKIPANTKNKTKKQIKNLLNDEKINSLPNGIKGLVIAKIINFDCSIKIDNKLSNTSFSKYSIAQLNELINSLNDILDNAIEASNNMTNPLVTLSLYEDNKHIFICVGNNFNNIIDINKLGDKYYSTKQNHSGLGLFFLNRHNIKKHIDITNNFFSFTLELKKP